MNRHKILFVVAYIVMPAMLAWIGYLVYDLSPQKADKTESSASTTGGTAYYDLPRVSLSMNSGAGSTGTFKVDLSLEVKQNDLSRVSDYEPRIIDRVLMYMRKQSFEDLREPGSAKKLRIGLEREIDESAVPIHIASVIVREMVFE